MRQHADYPSLANWSLFTGAGREHLGDMMPVGAYRLFAYTMHDAICAQFSASVCIEVFREAGRRAGDCFYRNYLHPATDMGALLAKWQATFMELKLGIVNVESTDCNGNTVLTIAEDLDCSGLPVLGDTVYHYDEGFLSGMMTAFFGRPYIAVEIGGWAKGGVCRFHIKGDVSWPTNDHTKTRLANYLLQVHTAQLPIPLDEDEDISDSPLPDCLITLLQQNKELNPVCTQLASGDVHCAAPRDGPSKDMQSTLRRLIWQLECVVAGDYRQRVKFFGDFSTAFNLYTHQIALREHYQSEAAMLDKQRLEQLNAMLTQQLQFQLAHYESLKDAHQKVHGIRHDIKNHCFVLNEFLNSGDLCGAQQYLGSICETLLSNSENIYNTGNPIFDALLTEKLGRAQANGILIHVYFSIKPNLTVKNIDWCVLLGNALDNAIEGCAVSQAAHQIISAKIIMCKDTLGISIQNTSRPPKLRADGTYDSSKPHPEMHGRGLSSIEQVVKKYNGALHTWYKNDHFYLSCALHDV